MNKPAHRPRPPLPVTTVARSLNDLLRRYGIGGETTISSGIAALATDDIDAIRWATAKFDYFDAELDPKGEHACGKFEIRGYLVVFTIEGDQDMVTDHSTGKRVLALMLEAEFIEWRYVRAICHQPFIGFAWDEVSVPPPGPCTKPV